MEIKDHKSSILLAIEMEKEVITVILRQVGTIKKLKFDIDFASLSIKGRASKGNLASKYPIKKIEIKEKGISTLLQEKYGTMIMYKD
jgi:topoisomerase-4 subunit A